MVKLITIQFRKLNFGNQIQKDIENLVAQMIVIVIYQLSLQTWHNQILFIPIKKPLNVNILRFYAAKGKPFWQFTKMNFLRTLLAKLYMPWNLEGYIFFFKVWIYEDNCFYL